MIQREVASIEEAERQAGMTPFYRVRPRLPLNLPAADKLTEPRSQRPRRARPCVLRCVPRREVSDPNQPLPNSIASSLGGDPKRHRRLPECPYPSRLSAEPRTPRQHGGNPPCHRYSRRKRARSHCNAGKDRSGPDAASK